MKTNGAPRPAFDSGDWISRADRAYRSPQRTAADHGDDDLHKWEMSHGRVGASMRDKDPMATTLWVILILMAGALAVAAGLIGAYW